MTEKKGCREPNPKAPDSMSENNPVSVAAGTTYHNHNQDRSSNPSIITENLAKNITVRQNQNEIILMFLQGMRQDQNEKLDILIEEESSTRKILNLVNANLAEIIAIIKDKRIQSRESGL